jgi:hypothetical protein
VGYLRSQIEAVDINRSDKQRAQSPTAAPRQELAEGPRQSRSYLGIGAKTLAGVGLGLAAVLALPAVLGLATEAVLVPSLLLKLAGGMAGGGVGMAKGLKDERPNR